MVAGIFFELGIIFPSRPPDAQEEQGPGEHINSKRDPAKEGILVIDEKQGSGCFSQNQADDDENNSQIKSRGKSEFIHLSIKRILLDKYFSYNKSLTEILPLLKVSVSLQ